MCQKFSFINISLYILEPNAIELMSQFISMAPDNPVPPIQYDLTNAGEPMPPIQPPADSLNISRKQLALKILALKVATWLKWNLDLLEKSLPLPKQIFLLRDLCTLSFGKLISVPLSPDFVAKISKYILGYIAD